MKKKIKKEELYFPQSVLRPVGNFLLAQLAKLKVQRRHIAEDDPFRNVSSLAMYIEKACNKL